jgi:putative ABC transport system permease protein
MNFREIKYACRSINKNLLNSIIIVISIAVGLACTNLISVFILRELQHDDFHNNKDRIHLMQSNSPLKEGEKIFYVRNAVPEYMVDNYPEVEDYCQVTIGNIESIVVDENNYYSKENIIWASDNFFRFFTFDLVVGSAETVLETDNCIVISEQLADKYFGKRDIVGEELSISYYGKKNNYFVTGVFRKPKEASQLDFELVVLHNNKYGSGKCYLQISEGVQISELHKKFEADKKHLPTISVAVKGIYTLLPFKQAYYGNKDGVWFSSYRDKNDIIISAVIALIILVVAIFNYLGLLNNLLLNRIKEFSIRKINGLTTSRQVLALLVEYSILIFSGVLFSFILIVFAFPQFKELINSNIEMGYLYNFKSVLLMTGFILLLIVSTLTFIIFFVKRMILVEAIKSKPQSINGKQGIPAFNIFQFAATIILIIASIGIVNQMYFISNKDIGIDKSIVRIQVPIEHQKKAAILKEEILKSPLVRNVSVTRGEPLFREHFSRVVLTKNEGGIEKPFSPFMFEGDIDLIEILELSIIEGNGFSPKGSNEKKCIINESLAKEFAPMDLVGKSLPGYSSMEVVGIVKDFHYTSIQHIIEPACIVVGNSGGNLLIKGNGVNNALLPEEIRTIYSNIIPDSQFEYTTMGEQYELLHESNMKLVKLIGSCAAISIFLSLIGLFAISLHSIRLRIKEIGVRKVNGVRVSEILQMLNSDFIKWVAIAYIIATPIGYYAMNKWLENFAYKTDLGWWIFAVAGLLALIIALVTVSWQSWKAATKNPVEALRYE